MFTVHFLEISIAFVLKLYSLNIIKKSRIESRACESKLNRIGTSESIPSPIVQPYPQKPVNLDMFFFFWFMETHSVKHFDRLTDGFKFFFFFFFFQRSEDSTSNVFSWKIKLCFADLALNPFYVIIPYLLPLWSVRQTYEPTVHPLIYFAD